MKSILFVCTGNIFRSMVAEYALKARVSPESRYLVGSAGIEALPASLHPLLRDYLQKKGINASMHVQRKLTRELLDSTDFTVAMGWNHQDFIRRHFGREVLLFNQVCYQKDEPILDVHEAVPNCGLNDEGARAYALSVIEYIWNATPALLARLAELS